MSMAFNPMLLIANTEKNPITMTTPTPAIPKEAQILIDRLNEIKNMDKSNLTSNEKKTLRKEVRMTKKQLYDGGYGGVYISVGAAIIIILLLILLL